MNSSELRTVANCIRRRDVQAVFEAGAGHVGGEMSVIDLLTALYFKVMSVNPKNPSDPKRDRLVLSKGHTALALYIVLSEKGFIQKEEIKTFLQPYSRLNGHPNRKKVPGVETNTGPLGHGLPIAVGMAKAAQLNRENWRTFVITGDGEMQEGSNWEAIMAGAQFKLDNLTLIIDHNRLQQGARLADTIDITPLRPKFEAFGWNVQEINGHDMDQIVNALDKDKIVPAKPTCIIAHTNKGAGISFMSDDVTWHHRVPNAEQYKQAMDELKKAAE